MTSSNENREQVLATQYFNILNCYLVVESRFDVAINAQRTKISHELGHKKKNFNDLIEITFKRITLL